MKVIDPSYEILTDIDGVKILKNLELAIRNCYKSEDKITDESYKKIVNHILSLNHLSTIEHESVTVRIICNRGFLAEITRHRVASFSVESTRYCSYSKGKFGSQVTFIKPSGFDNWNENQKDLWFNAMKNSENHYMALLGNGIKAQQARGVLPIDLKTEIVMTANLREWRHIFQLRAQTAAHPDMRLLIRSMLEDFKQKIPLIFDDISY